MFLSRLLQGEEAEAADEGGDYTSLGHASPSRKEPGLLSKSIRVARPAKSTSTVEPNPSSSSTSSTSSSSSDLSTPSASPTVHYNLPKATSAAMAAANYTKLQTARALAASPKGTRAHGGGSASEMKNGVSLDDPLDDNGDDVSERKGGREPTLLDAPNDARSSSESKGNSHDPINGGGGMSRCRCLLTRLCACASGVSCVASCIDTTDARCTACLITLGPVTSKCSSLSSSCWSTSASVRTRIRASLFQMCSSGPCRPIACTCLLTALAPPKRELGEVMKEFPPLAMQRWHKIRALAQTSFDSSSSDHASDMYSFAAAIFGTDFSVSDTFSSEKWKTIGFQNKNPASDLRASGLLGLQHLHYLVHVDMRLVKRMTRSEHSTLEHYLPFALAGLNVTYMLVRLICLTSSPVLRVTEHEASVILGFAGLLAAENFALEEIYKTSMQLLADRWQDTRAKYMDFPIVVAFVRERIATALSQRPPTIHDFNLAIAALDEAAGDIVPS